MAFQFPDSIYTSDALASVALLLILSLARLIAGRALRHRENLTEQVVRRWTANFRNLLILIAVVGLTMIWAPQLRTFALSLTAVAVAIVVATKELILCLSGSALRTFTRAYSVGDIVEIGAYKGEVLDLNLLATRLSEFEEEDGSIAATDRIIIIPHSLLFSSPARVLSHSRGRLRHRFQMVFEPEVDLFALQSEIAAEAQTALERFASDEAAANATDSPKSHGPQLLPRVDLEFGTTEIGKYRIALFVTGDPARVRQLENALACSIGSFVHARRSAAASL